MSKEKFNSYIEYAKDQVLAGAWQRLLEYFGTETAEELDFSANFDYKEVYATGDIAECEAFYYIATFQLFGVDCAFPNNSDLNALTTKIQLELWQGKLYDKVLGREHTWLN